MIVAAPKLLSDQWMLIGRQEDTGVGGRIDLLAIAPDGALVLIELKRDKTPRDVVAQSLDYVSSVEKLRAEDIAAIYGRFAPSRNLGEDFQQRFGLALDEDSLNESHQIIIVASSLDASTERIVAYLSERDIPINLLCFQVFANGNEQLISRTWLLDPVKTQVSAAIMQDGPNEPWNGEFYHSFGTCSGERAWDDAVKYGFICGGGDAWYSRTLQLLDPGDRVRVKIPGPGFVGLGRVTDRAQRDRDFMVNTPEGEVRFSEVPRNGHYHQQFADDEEKSEYSVPVHRLQTIPASQAIQEIGMFGNQNTVCKPTTPKWRSTVERLKTHFPAHNKN